MTYSRSAVSLLYAAALFTGFLSMQAKSQVIRGILPAEVDSLTNADSTVILLDVRTRIEYEGELGHLRGARLIPVEDLERRITELEPLRDRAIVAYCRSGRRSAAAAMILSKRGFKAFTMEGGILRWNAEGLPVVKEHHGDLTH